MKLIFAAEDCIVGFLVGFMLIGFSGKFFHLPEWNTLWGILFVFSFILTVFDVLHSLTDLGWGHIFLVIFGFATNFIDAVIELLFIIKFFSLKIGFLNFLGPITSNPVYQLIFGIIFIVNSLFWLVLWPKYR